MTILENSDDHHHMEPTEQLTDHVTVKDVEDVSMSLVQAGLI